MSSAALYISHRFRSEKGRGILMGDIQTSWYFYYYDKVIIIAIMGGIIDLKRGAKNHSAGIRTHILVCLASALVMMTNEFIILKYGERSYKNGSSGN